MPYLVRDIVLEQEVITVTDQETIPKALSLMKQHDFSQLPVVNQHQKLLGVVTYESILKGVRFFNLRTDDLKVGDVLTPVPTFHLEDTLSDLLERLKTSSAVIILTAEKAIAGIVTTYDSTEYFRRYAEDLMLVEDIESTIKDLIRLIYNFWEGDPDPKALQDEIKNLTRHKRGQAFDKLTLGEYIQIMLSETTWPRMANILKMPSREAVLNILDRVRQTRNELAHFRGGISSDQRDGLEFCAEWLGHRQSEVQAALVQESLPTKEAAEIRPEMVNELIAEEVTPSDSRYAPLGSYFQSQPGGVDRVDLTFAQIEEIIGGELPPSAYKHRTWWDNNPEMQPHSSVWLEAGWRAGYRNMNAKSIYFVRIKEREKAYIDFFGALLRKLNEMGKLPLREPSPNGTSWMIAIQEHSSSFFGFSFARSKQFRVELYLDTGHYETTKQIFDHLIAHRESIDKELPLLKWERHDHRRGARIALYHPGEITDSKKELVELQKWAANTLVQLYETLNPFLKQATKEVL